MPSFQSLGISLEAIHRISAMAAGTLDTLPHFGAVITLLAVCKVTRACPNYKKREALKVTFEVFRYPSRTFPEKLKKCRLELGLTPVDLADLPGVNERTIVKWEKGYVRPHRKNRQLAEDFIKGSPKRRESKELMGPIDHRYA